MKLIKARGWKGVSGWGALPVLIWAAAINLTAEESLPGTVSNVVIDPLNLDILWVLVASALVFLMQAGFMCLESGFARAKNSINVAIKNLTDFVVAVAGFWIVGFGIMFGATASGWAGTDHFLLSGGIDAWTMVFFVFQAMFCGTAATIFSGAVAERFSFGAYVMVSVAVSIMIYPVFGHWAWGGLLSGEASGWLEKKGFLDFAGSTVVHSIGGWISLAGIIVVGPRQGRFDESGKPRRIHPHNFVMVYLGAFLLFFGWFGFNCGSTTSVTSDIAPIAMNTLIGACFGGIACGVCSLAAGSKHRLEPDAAINGVLGGLVGITAGCNVVDPAGACLIGLGSGVVVFVSTWILENVLRLDDVVGAVPVHGCAGAWGTIATAFFMNSDALAAGTTRMDQVFIQIQGVVAGFVWAFGSAFIILKIINTFHRIRVSGKAESLGLNVAEHGAKSSILELAQAMHRATASNDFTTRVEVEFGTEIGDLSQSFNEMIGKLHEAKLKEARDLKQHLQKIDEVRSEELSGFDIYLRDHVERMGNEVSLMQQSLDEMSSQAQETVRSVQEIFREVSDFERALSEVATSVSRSSKETTSHMQSMVEKMQEVAAQTNLLAINASVESARAGEAGRGFTVVSNEVRQLALTSGEASRQIAEELLNIRQLNDHITHAVAQRTEEIRKLNDVVESIVRRADQQADLLGHINNAARNVMKKIEGAYDVFRDKFIKGGPAEEPSGMHNTHRNTAVMLR